MKASVWRLLDSELRRFAARRAIRFVLAVGLLIATIVNVAQFVRADERLRDFGETEVPRAMVDPACVRDAQARPIQVDDRCFSGTMPKEEVAPTPTVRIVLVAEVDRRPRIGATFGGTIAGIGAGFIFPALLLAATFLAAEFNAAGLSSLLSFEPRRWRVYLVKLLAAALGSAAVLALIILWTGAGQYLISALRGSTAGIDAAWFGRRLADYGRVVLATSFAVAFSFAITSVTRRTVAAVGTFFGLFIAQNFLAATPWGETVARFNPISACFLLALNEFGDSAGADLTFGKALAVAAGWAVITIAACGRWFSRSELR